MLFDTLRKDNMQAMKDRDSLKKNAISLAISKIQLVLTEKRGKGEELTDADAIQVIQKLIKEIEEEALAFKNASRMEKYEELLKQKDILSVYLPKMMSEDEIRNEINNLQDKSIPSIMKHFKMNFQGKCDMSLVNKIAREYQ